MRPIRLAVLMLLAANGAIPAAGPATQPEPAAQPTTVSPAPAQIDLAAVRTIDKEFRKARLQSLDLTGDKDAASRLTFLADGSPVGLPIAEVVRITLARESRMPDKAVGFLTTSGEWIAGLIVRGDARQVVVGVPGLGEVALPLRQVRGVLTAAGRAGPPFQDLSQLERSLFNDQAATAGPADAVPNDTVSLSNGETISGTVIGIDAKGLTVAGPLGNVTVPLNVLTQAKLINPLSGPLAAGPGDPTDKAAPLAWIETAGGSRLLAGTLQARGQSLLVTRAAAETAEPLEVREEYLSAIEIARGRWRWLDRLSPLVSEHQPFMTVRWPARFGANVMGGPLKLGARTFAHGIGVHSASRLVFHVAGASRFCCRAGLDAVAGPLADVNIQVRADGQPKFERKGVKSSDPPILIDLDLAGATELELRVDFGANADVQDRFDWAEAMVIY